MSEYHKIQTVYKRTEHGELMLGHYSEPEFAYLVDSQWTATEKVDGTNVRVMFNEDGIKFGGKTDNAQMPVFLFDRLTALFEGAAGALDVGMCLYGEGFGAKIQKGGGNYIADGCDFVLFDVKFGDDLWLERENVTDIAAKLSLTVVPMIMTATLDEIVNAAAPGFDSQWGDFQAEGFVMRPTTELRNRRGGRIITKIKCRDFKRLVRDE